MKHEEIQALEESLLDLKNILSDYGKVFNALRDNFGDDVQEVLYEYENAYMCSGYVAERLDNSFNILSSYKVYLYSITTLYLEGSYTYCLQSKEKIEDFESLVYKVFQELVLTDIKEEYGTEVNFNELEECDYYWGNYVDSVVKALIKEHEFTEREPASFSKAAVFSDEELPDCFNNLIVLDPETRS